MCPRNKGRCGAQGRSNVCSSRKGRRCDYVSTCVVYVVYNVFKRGVWVTRLPGIGAVVSIHKQHDQHYRRLACIDCRFLLAVEAAYTDPSSVPRLLCPPHYKANNSSSRQSEQIALLRSASKTGNGVSFCCRDAATGNLYM